MSLLFGAATSDRVAIAAQTTINDLAAFSYLFWLYPTALTQDRRFFSKQTTGASQRNNAFYLSNSGDLRFAVQRATTDANAQTSTVLSTDLWQCVAFTFDTTDGPRVFTGSLTAAMAEASYGVRTVGTGAAAADSANPLYIGNLDTFVQAFPGRIAVVALLDRRMTLAEVQKWQFFPQVDTNTRVFMHLGYNGTGTQPDWACGSAVTRVQHPGTVTGATVDAHVPLGPIFGFAMPSRYAVAAGGGSVLVNPFSGRGGAAAWPLAA